MAGRRRTQPTPQQGALPVEDYRHTGNQCTGDAMQDAAASGAARGNHGKPRGEHAEGLFPAFEELAEVALAVPVHDKISGRDLPAGARGTVVGVWHGGRAYEVEFTEPFECLVTVPAEGLAA